jgi:molybdopterin/thiamine biosynthesis adenylyltransferase
MSTQNFNYELAFSRTVGFVTKEEQQILRGKTVAVAGLGGVGGGHVITLARLGIGSIHIADMDDFGIENFNRQAGANMNTVGRSKAEVAAEMARAINPEIKIKVFPQGVNTENIAQFFDGVDAYIDGLDFFAFKIRKAVFNYCHDKKIPATTVGPIGMGAAMVNFIPGKMSFDDYFQWKAEDSDLELAIKFYLGITPKGSHRVYIVDHTVLNFNAKKGPSTPMGCELAAGVACTQVLKILLNRGDVKCAPHSVVFDAYLNKTIHTYLPWGNRGPLQRLKFLIARKTMSKQLAQGS